MVVSNALDDKLLSPTDEHALLRTTLRDFVGKEVEPQAQKYDQAAVLNRKLMTQAAELGLLGITIPAADGGAGMDATAAVIAHEELGYSDPGFALAYLSHAILFVNNMYWAANADQRQRYLSRVISGQWIGAMGMTEAGGRHGRFGNENRGSS